MAVKITVSSQKGGQSKTTTTAVLAEILSEIGYKVLVVDMDTQGNATQMLTGESIYKYSGKTIMEAVKEQAAEEYTVEIKPNLHLLPAEDMLATFSRYIYSSRIKEPVKVIKRTIEPIEHKYDFVFMDVPPSLGDIVLNAIVYADYVVIPVDYGAFGLDALGRFVDFLETAREEGHTQAQILGILLTLKDVRSKHERGIGEAVREEYGDLVFNTEIRKLAKIKEFALFGVDLKQPAMDDYLKLSDEIIQRIGGQSNE